MTDEQDFSGFYDAGPTPVVVNDAGRPVPIHASGPTPLNPPLDEKERLLTRLAELEAFEWLDMQIAKNANNGRMSRRLQYLRKLALAGRDYHHEQ